VLYRISSFVYEIFHQHKADVSKTSGIMLLLLHYYTRVIGDILYCLTGTYITRNRVEWCDDPLHPLFIPRETAPALSIIRRAFNGHARLMRKSHLRFLRYANDDSLPRGIEE